MIEPASTDALVGRVLGERYRIVRRIGAGGMGTVYLAQQESLRREVAVKVIRAGVIDDRYRVRFEAEALATSRLQDPHVVAVYDFGFDGDLPFIVFEKLEGSDLATALRVHGRMPWRRGVHVLRGIALALAAAARSGIVHRDLKPANVFLTSTEADPDFVKVLDFGIAKMADQSTPSALTEEGTVVGSAGYIAPERLLQSESDSAASDVYALGVIAWDVLAGRPPFVDTNAMALAVKHLHELPPRMRDVVEVPLALDELVHRLLAKNPAARPTPRELAQALDAIAAEPDTAETETAERPAIAVARPPPVAAVAATAPPPRRWWPAAAALALLVAVSGVAWRSFGPLGARTVETSTRAAPVASSAPRILRAYDDLLLLEHAVSSDGRLLVTLERVGGNQNAPVTAAFLQKVGEPSRTPLVPGRHPKGVSFSADDQRVLLTLDDEVVAVDVATLEASTYLAETGLLYVEEHSNGAKLLLRSDRTLVVVLPDGTRLSRSLSSDRGAQVHARWSARGDGILCTIGGTWDARISILSADLKTDQEVANPDEALQLGTFVAAAFFDDTTVLFATRLPDRPGVRMVVRSFDRQGGLTTVAEFPDAEITGIAVAARTRQAFVTPARQDKNVYVARMDDLRGKVASDLSAFRLLTHHPADDRSPAWLDNETVLFVSRRTGGWDVFSQKLSSTVATALTSGETWETYPQVTPAGALLFWRLAPPHAAEDAKKLAELVLAPMTVLTREEVPVGREWGRPLPRRFGCSCSSAGCSIWRTVSSGIAMSTVDVRGVARAKADPERMLALLVEPDEVPVLAIQADGSVAVNVGASHELVRFDAAGQPAPPVWLGSRAPSSIGTYRDDGFIVSGQIPSFVALIDADGKLTYLVDNGDDWLGEVAASPDGEHIALTARAWRQDLVVLDIDSAGSAPVR